MSYKAPERTEYLSEFFSRLVDFNLISGNLLSAKTDEEFELWFEKLELIDKRYLYLFIKKNHKKIPIRRLKLIRDRFDYRFI